jgi:hypothetical protein
VRFAISAHHSSLSLSLSLLTGSERRTSLRLHRHQSSCSRS